MFRFPFRPTSLCLGPGPLLIREQFPHRSNASQNPGGFQGQEDLGRLSVCDLGQSLQVLDGDQVAGGIPVVDGAEDPFNRLPFAFGNGELSILFGVGHLLDRFGLALGFEHS